MPSEEFADASQVFAEFDGDGNGFIEKDELKNALAKAGVDFSQEQVDNLMGEIDTDGDGRVNFQEFRAFVGVSKAITKDKVIEKMNLRMIDGLKQASGPDDLAVFMAQLQAQRRAELARIRAAGGGNSGLAAFRRQQRQACCLLILSLILLLVALTLQGMWVWGILIAQNAFSDGVEGICHAGATWIMVQAVFGISSFVLTNIIQKFYLNESLSAYKLASRRRDLERFKKLIGLFGISWLVYGSTLFYSPEIVGCPALMASFGFGIITFMFRYVHAPCVVINRRRSLIVREKCIRDNLHHLPSLLPPSVFSQFLGLDNIMDRILHLRGVSTISLLICDTLSAGGR